MSEAPVYPQPPMNESGFAELVSKMAHELRSPLTSIKGFSATLMKRWDRFTDEQKRQFVETIHADSERMSRIVSEVLDLARLEANRLELNQTAADIASIAKKSLENVATLTGSERIRIELGDQDLVAWADEDRLERVLTNLLENAIKFSEEGPVVVEGGRVDGSIEIRVTDRGIGIEKERLETVFAGAGPPGQVATPRGTGLGLHLSRRLLEAHGGSISVESEQGVGSTFILRLPARPDPGAA